MKLFKKKRSKEIKKKKKSKEERLKELEIKEKHIDMELEKWIKIQELKPSKFYVISVGDENHEPTYEIVTKIFKRVKKKLPKKSKLMVFPYYSKMTGFEPIKGE